MIAPEKWYEHQKEYQRYGIDMKPQPQRQMRSQKKRKIKKISLPAGNGKKLAFSTVLAAGIAMIMLIIITAYSAGVRYDINCMIKENQALMGEIENLQVKLYSASNIDYVEGKAVSSLGMIYPSSKNSVRISSDDMPAPGFADVLKENAYN